MTSCLKWALPLLALAILAGCATVRGASPDGGLQHVEVGGETRVRAQWSD